MLYSLIKPYWAPWVEGGSWGTHHLLSPHSSRPGLRGDAAVAQAAESLLEALRPEEAGPTVAFKEVDTTIGGVLERGSFKGDIYIYIYVYMIDIGIDVDIDSDIIP